MSWMAARLQGPLGIQLVAYLQLVTEEGLAEYQMTAKRKSTMTAKKVTKKKTAVPSVGSRGLPKEVTIVAKGPTRKVAIAMPQHGWLDDLKLRWQLIKAWICDQWKNR
jgi:hypothetical protein